MVDPFDPGLNNTIEQANATSSAGGSLPDSAQTVLLTNTSTTATVYWASAAVFEDNNMPNVVVPSGATRGGMPVRPGAQIRVSVPSGRKQYRTIASAADGSLLITPGKGN